MSKVLVIYFSLIEPPPIAIRQSRYSTIKLLAKEAFGYNIMRPLLVQISLSIEDQTEAAAHLPTISASSCETTKVGIYFSLKAL